MAELFEIVRIQESFRIDPGGDSTQTKQVLFRVGKDGPFSIEIPSAEFTAERARELISEEARKIAELRGSRP